MLVLDVDDRPGADVVVGVVLDHDGRPKALAQLGDTRLEEPLVVLRGVILEVLGEVAECAGRRDRLDRRRAPRPLELRQLRRKGLALLLGQDLAVAAHGRDGTEAPTAAHRRLRSERRV